MPSLYNDRLLNNTLRALRHVPVGTGLPQPIGTEDRQLLADLLALPDNVRAERWLQDERGSIIALITLRKTLHRLRSDILGEQRSRWEGWIRPEVFEQRLGGLARLPLDAEPLVNAERNALSMSADDLRNILGQLWQLRQPINGPRIPSSTDDPSKQALWLPHDLMHLTNDDDPIEWLQRERGTLSAEITLSYIINQCQPMRTPAVGMQTEWRSLRQRLWVFDKDAIAAVTLREIRFGRGGFSLSTSLWLRTWDRLSAQQSKERMLTWMGFDRIADDIGNEYLLKHTEVETLLLFGWSREYLTMAFYPAVAEGAKMLTFASDPFILEVEGRRGGPYPLPERAVGHLTWQVPPPTNG